jgi:predicted acylesterase/phospholipase RssA
MWSFQSICKKNIKFDIIAGTSIGGINGAIAAGFLARFGRKQLRHNT